MARDWDAKKAETLSRLDIRSELESFGIRFASDSPTSSGWLSCHNPYKADSDPSAGVCVGDGSQRGYLVTFNNTGGLSDAISFWDLARDFHPSLFGDDFFTILNFYAKKTGVEISSNKSKNNKSIEPPSLEMAERFRKEAHSRQEVMRHYSEKRGFTKKTIESYQLGFCPVSGRLTIPIIENGEVENFKFHSWQPQQKPKSLNLDGFGKIRLFGIDRLKESKSGFAVITEGEFDAIMVSQATDGAIPAVSSTGGAMSFKKEWLSHLKGKDVVILFDCDEAGRNGANRLKELCRPFVYRGDIKSLRLVWLFENPSKGRKDFTDFITKAGGSGEALIDAVESTKPIIFDSPESPGEKSNEVEANPLKDSFQNTYRLISIQEIYETPRTIDPIVNGLLYGGESLLIHAPGGVGKSLLFGLYLPLILANPFDFSGDPIPLFGYSDFICEKPRNSLIIQSEGSWPTTRERLQKMLSGDKTLSNGLQKIFFLGHGSSIRVSGDFCEESFRSTILRQIEEADRLGSKLEVMVIDPLVSFHRLDENSAEMRTVLDFITAVSTEAGCTVVLIHHGRKNGDGQEYRGSTAISDWARSVISLREGTVDGKKSIIISHKKSNLSERFSDFVIQLDENLLPHCIDSKKILGGHANKQVSAVIDALRSLGGKNVPLSDLVKQITQLSGMKEKTAYKWVTFAVKNDFIDRTFEAFIPESGKKTKNALISIK